MQKIMASGNACNPVIFEPMVMSIMLAQRKLLHEIESKLNEVLWQEICVQENDEEETESKQYTKFFSVKSTKCNNTSLNRKK